MNLGVKPRLQNATYTVSYAAEVFDVWRSVDNGLYDYCPVLTPPLRFSEPKGSTGTMPSTFRILYWKEIPVQVEAEDDAGKVSVPLDHRFQEAADAIAMFDGSYGSDAYLDAWQWGGSTESKLAASEIADAVAARFNQGMPEDFVARIRDLHNSGDRSEMPGSIEGWIE